MLDHVLQKTVAEFQPLLQLLRSPHDQIQGKLTIEFHADRHRLIDFVTRRHDDEQVNIAVPVSSAFGIGTEQDHPLRLKALDDHADRAFQFGFRDELFGL